MFRYGVVIRCPWCREPAPVEDGRIGVHDTYITQDHDGAKIATAVRCGMSYVMTPEARERKVDKFIEQEIALLREIRDLLRTPPVLTREETT